MAQTASLPAQADTTTSTWLSDEAILGIESDTSVAAAAPDSSPDSAPDSANHSGASPDSVILRSDGPAGSTKNLAVPREQQGDADGAHPSQDADRTSATAQEPRATDPPAPRALPAATLEQLDAAYYSPEPAARAQFAQTLFASDPAAFRAMFNEAARLLGVNLPASAPAPQTGVAERAAEPAARGFSPASAALNDAATSSQAAAAPGSFPVAAYRAFESAANDVLSRDVRAAIGRTLEQVLPEGTAEGAARRIADDIYGEIGQQLAGDAQLSSQVGEVLRGWRFGAAEQQQVNALLSGRARQMLPSVARRVIGEWTSSVLATARTRAARSDAATRRVDVGNAASRPAGNAERARSLTPKEIDYARTSDDDILSM
ncbi:MAG: hypothetical protein ACLP1Y_12055 [Candidatus Acidiferrales bacterium]